MASTQLYDPRTQKIVDVNDISVEAAATSFVAAEMVDELQPYRPIRYSFWESLFGSLGSLIGKPFKLPSHVAAGTIFSDPILQTRFDTGVSEATMYWYIVCPQTLGGTADHRVYLTSTNLAGAGAEGLIRYANYKDDASFCIADRSRVIVKSWLYTDAVVVQRHLTTLTIDGNPVPALYVANKTSGSGTTWTDEILLFNSSSGAFDSIWTDPSFFWDPSKSSPQTYGPIFEVHDPIKAGITNLAGFAEATLIIVDQNGSRKTWKLDPNNSDFGLNGVFQFDKVYLSENHTFIAN